MVESGSLISIEGRLAGAHDPDDTVIVFRDGVFAGMSTAAAKFGIPLSLAPGQESPEAIVRVFLLNQQNTTAQEFTYPQPCTPGWLFAPPANWRGTNCQYIADTPLQMTADGYRGALDFGLIDTQQFMGPGWAFEASNVSWATSYQSVLNIPLPLDLSRLQLTARVKPFLAPPERIAQNVYLLANGEQLASWRLDSDEMTDITWHVPAAVLGKNPGTLQLKFLTPDSISPQSLGQGDDLRKLSLAVARLELFGEKE